MSNIDKMMAKYAAKGNEVTPARLKKLIGHSVPLVRINTLGVRGLRFHVAAVDAVKGIVSLTEEKSGDKEEVRISEISLSPRKSMGEGPHSFPAGF